MEPPAYYLLAPNVPLLNPKARHRLVNDPLPYLPAPIPPLASLIRLKPRAREAVRRDLCSTE